MFHDKEKFELAPIATIDEKAVSGVDEKSMDFESTNEEPDIDKPLGKLIIYMYYCKLKHFIKQQH